MALASGDVVGVVVGDGGTVVGAEAPGAPAAAVEGVAWATGASTANWVPVTTVTWAPSVTWLGS